MVEIFKRHRSRAAIALAIFLVLTPVVYMAFGNAAERIHLHRLPAIVVAVFALTICGWLDRHSRAGDWREVFTLRSGADALISGARFFRHYGYAIVGLAIALVWNADAPPVDALPPAAYAVLDAATKAGQIWLATSLLFEVVQFAVNPPNAAMNFPVSVSIRLFERFAMYMLAMAGIRMYSGEVDALVKAIIEAPQTSIEVSLGIAIIGVAISVVPRSDRNGVRVADAAGIAVAGIGIVKERTPKDFRRTCVHEIAHLLPFAALPSLPDDLLVIARDRVSLGDQYLGRVYHGGMDYERTESFQRWFVLVDRASTVAERLVYGAVTAGVNGDNGRWTARAQDFLANGFGEVFYGLPENDAQIAHNRAVINTLRDSHDAALLEFLKTNRDLLNELADLLEKEHELNKERVQPYLQRVEFTDGVQPLHLD